MPYQHKLVLVCPLDWGLGHASRMIPVINRYISCGYEVMLGGSGKSGELLKITFPKLKFIAINSPVIYYSRSAFWLIPSLIWQLPGMMLSVIIEHHRIKKIVKYYNINIIVSDNRYGLFCNLAHSIFVTHQISPVLPTLMRWAEYPLYLIIRKIMLQYDECWIPDYADLRHNLGGKLSHRFKLPANARYIGILSRFDTKYHKTKRVFPEKYELVVVLSGPEPQLGKISEIIIRQAATIPNKTLIISGWRVNPDPLPESDHGQLKILTHLEPGKFGQAILNAGIIVCRSGYSGIMDLVSLGRTAILVPTPGQPEQNYLARYLNEKGLFSCIAQHELNLENLLKTNEMRDGSDFGFNFEVEDELPITSIK